MPFDLWRHVRKAARLHQEIYAERNIEKRLLHNAEIPLQGLCKRVARLMQGDGREKIPALLRDGRSCYLLFLRSGRCVKADAATDFCALVDLGLLRIFEAREATFFDVFSFFGMAILLPLVLFKLLD